MTYKNSSTVKMDTINIKQRTLWLTQCKNYNQPVVGNQRRSPFPAKTVDESRLVALYASTTPFICIFIFPSSTFAAYIPKPASKNLLDKWNLLKAIRDARYAMPSEISGDRQANVQISTAWICAITYLNNVDSYELEYWCHLIWQKVANICVHL